MNDKAFRPAITNKVENMEQYNLDGKTIVPFTTSGSSQMGKTNEDLRKSCGNVIMKDSKRFATGVSERELKSWTDSI